MCKATTPPKRVFIVGGFNSMVFGNFERNLNENGIKIGGHHQKGDVLRAIPSDCDGVIIMYDMVGHHIMYQAEKLADIRNLPLVRVPRKWSVAVDHLRKTGFLPEETTVPVLDKTTIPAPEETNLPSTLSEKVRALIEKDPELVLKPNSAVEVLIKESPTLVRREVEQEMVAAISVFRKIMEDRTRTGTAQKQKFVKAWLIRWFERVAAKEDDIPTFGSFRKRGKELFGVALNYDFVHEARIVTYGAWAEDVNFASRLTDWFERQEPQSEYSLIQLLEAGKIDGVETRNGWITSKAAIENWRTARSPEPTISEPEPEPAIPESDPSTQTYEVDLSSIVKEAIKEAITPLEEQIVLLQLHVEELKNTIKNGKLQVSWITPE